MGILRRITDTLGGRSVSGVSVAHATAEAGGCEVLTFQDYLAMRTLAFEWADSYDCKDQARLRNILAPIVRVDYTEVNGNEYASMSAEQLVAFVFHEGFVGDPLVKTQHLLGASKFIQISPTEFNVFHQIRAAHQRYTAADRETVENKGHGHAMVEHTYKKIHGQWKLAGLRPEVRWNEFAFDKIFIHFDPHAILKPSTQDVGKVTRSAVVVEEALSGLGKVEFP